jgi:hypothetical protein
VRPPNRVAHRTFRVSAPRPTGAPSQAAQIKNDSVNRRKIVHSPGEESVERIRSGPRVLLVRTCVRPGNDSTGLTSVSLEARETTPVRGSGAPSVGSPPAGTQRMGGLFVVSVFPSPAWGCQGRSPLRLRGPWPIGLGWGRWLALLALPPRGRAVPRLAPFQWARGCRPGTPASRSAGATRTRRDGESSWPPCCAVFCLLFAWLLSLLLHGRLTV